MKLDVFIDLTEAVRILRQRLSEQLPGEIGTITVTSYDKPKLTISEDDMVEGVEFRHRLVE